MLVQREFYLASHLTGPWEFDGSVPLAFSHSDWQKLMAYCNLSALARVFKCADWDSLEPEQSACCFPLEA